MPNAINKPCILIVAAEASSAHYAKNLLSQWQLGSKLAPTGVDAFGVGSREMEALGFEIVGRSEEMAVMGLLEVASHWNLIKSTFHKLVEMAERRRPDFVLLMDYPDFNFRLAKEMKKLGIKVIYYISPQLWVWRTGRVKLVQKYIDEMIVLFPFEVDFYLKFGVKVHFLGHPLLDEADHFVGASWKEKKQVLLGSYGITGKNPVLGLMPGSRKSEIERLFVVQVKAAELIAQQKKNLEVLVLVAPTVNEETLKGILPSTELALKFIKADPYEMISMTDVVLCASGTASLMVALLEKPLLIMYRFNPVSLFLGKFIAKMPKFFGLPNLILDKMIVPEIFQEAVTPENLARQAIPLFEGEARENMIQALRDLKFKLGDKGANRRVAEFLSQSFLSKIRLTQATSSNDSSTLPPQG